MRGACRTGEVLSRAWRQCLERLKLEPELPSERLVGNHPLKQLAAQPCAPDDRRSRRSRWGPSTVRRPLARGACLSLGATRLSRLKMSDSLAFCNE